MDLLIKSRSSKSIEDFVAGLGESIGLPAWERRQSSNYIGERYYRCFVLGLEIIVSESDDAAFPDYDYWLLLKPEVPYKNEYYFSSLLDCIARKLALNGDEVLPTTGAG